MADARYDQTIRDFLGLLIGQTIVDITQHDKDEYAETHCPYVQIHCASGVTLTIWQANGDLQIDDPTTGGSVCVGLTGGDDEEDAEVDHA